MQADWDHYGEHQFSFERIGSCSEDEAISQQMAVYNKRPNADSNRGFCHSQETKDRIRASTKGRDLLSPEARQRAAYSLRGQKKPVHVLKAAREANAKMWAERGDEMRAKQRRLTNDQVYAIRMATGRYADIGDRYGISASTVCLIKQRKRYAEI